MECQYDIAKEQLDVVLFHYRKLKEGEGELEPGLTEFGIIASDQNFLAQNKSIDDWLIEKDLMVAPEKNKLAEKFLYSGVFSAMIGIMANNPTVLKTLTIVSLICAGGFGNLCCYKWRVEKNRKKYFGETGNSKL